MNNFKNKMHRKESEILVSENVETKEAVLEEVKLESEVKKEKSKRKKKEQVLNSE